MSARETQQAAEQVPKLFATIFRMDDLAVIIVSYNCRELLRKCLLALPASLHQLAARTYVVDNDSTDGSAAMVATEFPDVDLDSRDENLGFAGANNVAIRRVDARYVLLLNPDTEPEPGSIRTLVAFMDAHPDVGACGPLLLNTDGSLQRNGRVFPTLMREFLEISSLRWRNNDWFERTFDYGRSNYGVECEVDSVTGACLIARREAIEQVGLLDEQFYMYYEEVDWCHRMKRAGWKVYYVPSARVVHHWMGSIKAVAPQMVAHLSRSRLLYFRKNKGTVAAGALQVMQAIRAGVVAAGVAVKAGLRRTGLIRRAT